MYDVCMMHGCPDDDEDDADIAEHGLLSFLEILSLLRAFRLHVIKRNGVERERTPHCHSYLAGRLLSLWLFVLRKIQRCRGAGACLWLVAALCVGQNASHNTQVLACFPHQLD